MKVTAATRRALAFLREERALLRAGYRRHETDWEIHRGGRYDEVILDAFVSQCGKYVYTKLGKQPPNELADPVADVADDEVAT